MNPRLLRALLALLAIAAGSVTLSAQAPAVDLAVSIGRLGSLDYATRTGAARQVRRAPAPAAVAALTAAVRESRDEFVRFRALVLLTGFNDGNTPALMRELIRDRNDRVRETVLRWFEQHPDPSLVPALLTGLEVEQAEFVRPALIRALAASSSTAPVQRALMIEAGRGLDFFRSAVIEALGLVKARWSVNTITEIARIDGPLQDDAIVALGRIGDPDSLALVTMMPSRPVEVATSVLAARCLLGDECPARIAALNEAIGSRVAARDASRAGFAALTVIAVGDNAGLAAIAALLGNPTVHDDAAIALGGVALRNPERTLRWLDTLEPAARDGVVQALREALERFEEDYAEEQLFAAARAAYWAAPDGSAARTWIASLIDRLEF